MTDKKHTNKVTALKMFKTDLLVGNIVVAKRTQLKYRVDGSDYWNPIYSEEDLTRLNDIGSLEFYTHDEKTPEGQKMWDEYKAKEDEEDDED